MSDSKITIDLSKIDAKEFDAQRPLRVAALKNGKIIDQKTVTPAKEKDPRRFSVPLSLGQPEDGAVGAEIVVAPADDERNVFSKLTARKTLAGIGEIAGTVVINPAIYTWWRFCWFPRHYRITGRVQRHVDDCTHSIAGAHVEIYDVDYCWWWYRQDLITSTFTDANGFFDVSFTWCVPLWCLFEVITRPPVLIDTLLRDRLRAAFEERVPIKFPPPPPPPDPWTWERYLTELGIELPAARQFPTAAPDATRVSRAAGDLMAAPSAAATASLALSASSKNAAAALLNTRSPRLKAVDIFGPIFWPLCDEPCDWLPDIKIRVTQAQPGGTVVIYEDAWWQIHYDQDSDLLNLALEANASALYADDCHPDPLLGNCMVLDAVGTTKIMPTAIDHGIYQPDVTPGVSYGVTPDRHQRLGYVKDDDRPWSDVGGAPISVYGRFGIASHVDYYQIQAAQWTDGDLMAWDLDHTHVPPDGAFAPVPGAALPAFARSYQEEIPTPLHWQSETFGPNTVSGIPLLYKSRERFEQEYVASHGGSAPAPDFGGWYWYYFTETRLFDLDASKMANGYYTFRFVCYRQTGVDGGGNPILAPVTMGLPGGVGKRCTTTKPELLTLYLHDDQHVPDCKILNFTKNGTDVVDECAMVTLTPADWLEIEYQAFDAAGNLDSYAVTLQKGFSPEHDLLGLPGVTAVSGSSPEGPTYGAALVDMVPAIPPYWNGGTWKKKIPYSTFVFMGGSCAYNLRLGACDRHTNGFSAVCSAEGCSDDRAFTVILAP